MRWTLVALLATIVLPAAEHAQAQRASFVGVVSDSVTGTPLADASISIVNRDLNAVTDTTGQFELSGIETGRHTVVFRHLGYKPVAMRLQLTVNRPMRVVLGSIALVPVVEQLTPMVVEAEAGFGRHMAGFYNRMRSENGTFITAAEIEKINPRLTSEIIRRVPGFNTNPAGRVTSSRGIPSILGGFGSCKTEYFIDGLRADVQTVDVIIPTSIAGIEVYRGSASIPQTFRRLDSNAKCGVIAIWTRDGGRR